MFDDLRQNFQRQAELLLLGRCEDLAENFIYPLPLYLLDRMAVLQRPGQMTEVLREMHLALRLRKVRHLIADVAAVELPRQGRMRLWVDWEEISEGPAGHQVSKAIYYGRMTDKGFRAEAVQYNELSIPDLRLHLPAVAQIA